MSERIAGRSSSFALRVAAGLLLGAALWQAAASADDKPPPPTINKTDIRIRGSGHGGTAYSFGVEAEADYLEAFGRMQESLAVARKIHAEAYSLELDNWLKFVQVYWERKALYKKAYREAHPEEWKLEQDRQDRMRQRVGEQYQAVLRGSPAQVARAMNWLLRELSNSTYSYQFDAGEKELGLGEFNPKLSKDELKLIQLMEGGLGDKRLHFNAAEGAVASSKWPVSLRGPECEKACNNYELVRQAVVDEVKATGKLSYKSHTKLIEAINELFTALEADYPKEKRLANTEVFSVYNAGRTTLKTLLGQTNRIADINDASLFGDQFRFQGNDVSGLIRFMYRKGLEFAPPEPGAEGFYRTMFEYLRQMYLRVEQVQPAARAPGKADDAK
jgi:hypothetical protein